MDKLDQEILSELESRGFRKSAALAPLLGVGDRTIRRRVSIMRSKGLIKIIALPNPVLFGYKAWAKIGIKVEYGSLFQVARKLIEHPSVYFVAYAIGTFDIIIAVRFYTIDGLTHFVNSELTRVRGILNTEAMMLVWPRKYYNFFWPAPMSKKTKNGHEYYFDSASYNHYEADEIDRKILSVLMEDGLTRPAALKSRLGIGESILRKHLKDMLNNEVFKIEVVPNMEALEYEVWATMGITINHQSAHKVLDAIVKDPAVYLASASIGRFNLIIAARFHNIDLLNHFVNMKLPAIEGVSSVETFLHNKPLKYHNISWSTKDDNRL